MQSVDSSYLDSVGYDKANQVLYVTFTNGVTFSYDGVPWNVYNALMNAGSLGQYFYWNIRTSYPFSPDEPYEENEDDLYPGPAMAPHSITHPGTSFKIGG